MVAAIGNALKWFPDHRGLCVGLTAGAYGIGTAITIAPIDEMLKVSGYQHTFIVWGIRAGHRRNPCGHVYLGTTERLAAQSVETCQTESIKPPRT